MISFRACTGEPYRIGINPGKEDCACNLLITVIQGYETIFDVRKKYM